MSGLHTAVEVGSVPSTHVVERAVPIVNGLSFPEYVSFASGEMEHYDLTLELEKKMEELRREFMLQPEELMLRKRRETRENGDERAYEQQGEELCEVLKNQYRFSVSE